VPCAAPACAQAIDEAIARGLPRVEAGAQGEHKLQRGLLPNFTYSAHYMSDPTVRAAVGKFLERENSQVRCRTGRGWGRCLVPTASRVVT
jgi:predicted N-acyltransferase